MGLVDSRESLVRECLNFIACPLKSVGMDFSDQVAVALLDRAGICVGRKSQASIGIGECATHVLGGGVGRGCFLEGGCVGKSGVLGESLDVDFLFGGEFAGDFGEEDQVFQDI